MSDEPPKSKFLIEPRLPYYLHPSEGPGVSITAVAFDDKNYDLREKAVVTALRAKNKLRFIEGTLKKPVLVEGRDPMELQA